MSSPPAESSPSPSPANLSPAQLPSMSWSAIVKKTVPPNNSAAPSIPHASDHRVPAQLPAQQPPTANAHARLPPESTSYAQPHSPFSPSTGGRRGSLLDVGRAGHMSAARAGAQPAARGGLGQAGRSSQARRSGWSPITWANPFQAPPMDLSQGGRAGQALAAPTRSPYSGVYPVSASGNNYYRPPQARKDAQFAAKVTGSFANEAAYHSNSERRANVERSNATTATSLALLNARLATAATDTHTGRVNNTAHGTNVALPAHYCNDSVDIAGPSTVSRNAIISLNSGGNPAFNAPKPTSSDPSPAGFVGAEREKGTLTLTQVPQRRILAVTLGLLRSGVAAQLVQDSQWQAIKDFLNKCVPVGGGVPEYDEWLPSITVAYRYPIDDENWKNFEAVVSVFDLARDAQKVLGSSAAELDQVNARFLLAPLLPLKLPADEQIRNLLLFYKISHVDVRSNDSEE
ncbi:hypothetical protein PSPO01_09066 [Paraphaeosphaeria sporulosa]